MQLTLEQSFDFLEALKRDLGHSPEVMWVMAAMLAVVTWRSPVGPRLVHPRFDPDLAISTP
jgi:hypothetical protein